MEKLLTARQKKSQETKDKILAGAMKIIQEYGYEALTVKNICEVTGISNGSFFHYFRTKDELLIYYLAKGKEGYAQNYAEMLASDNFRQTMIDINIAYVNYCREAGLEFISKYYSTRNYALNPHNFGSKKDIDVGPYDDVLTSIKEAQKNGMIFDYLRPESIANDACLIIKGIIFDWCLTEGTVDMPTAVDRLLGMYCNSIITEKYVRRFGYYQVKSNW